MREMDVEGFIETNLAAERLEGEQDPKKQIAEMVASIKRAVPDLPDAELNKLPLEKLGVLVAFLRGIFDPDQKDVAAAVAAEAGAEGDAEKK